LYILDHKLYFPHPDTAHESGVLAIGGDLSPARLMLAYQYGIFPWFNPDEPPIWWHPDPRFVIFPEQIRVAKSMRPYFNKEKYSVTFDTCFSEVLTQCKVIKRKEGEGTWISHEIIDSYTSLYEQGFAHSVEVWEGNDLVGGLYGICLGRVFYGESMFSSSPNASKVALITLARLLEERGFYLIDCQIANDHLESMGGEYISRSEFMDYMRKNTFAPTNKNMWSDMGVGLQLKNII